MQGLLELVKAEDPDVLFLSETKLDKEGMKIKILLNMPHMEVTNCVGRSGGLALLWKEDVNLVVNPGSSRFHINAMVTGDDGFIWRITSICGEPQSRAKEKTWKLLRILHGQYNLPWMWFEDLKEVMFASEKQGGQAKKQACMDKFRMALEFCELEDLGFVGDPYTWRNHSHCAANYVKERLDRSVADLEWRTHFPAYKAINGDPRHSDHRPVIVILDPDPHLGSSHGVRERPKFEAFWLEEDQCEEVVHNAWHLALLSGDVPIRDAIRKVNSELHSWSKEVLGDLQNRIKKAMKDLNRCRKRALSQEQVSLEHMLRYKLERLQDQKNTFWKQRAKANWLKDGDMNTSFFHGCASERKKVNLLKKLKSNDGIWVEGDENLRSFITNYYQNLFTSSAGTRESEFLAVVASVVTSEMNSFLRRPFTVEEVKTALVSMGDLKAPGPDGMPAIFYKRFWELIGAKVQLEVLGVLNGGPIPVGSNEIVIVLIPKINKPERVKDLRPISLSNLVFKVVCQSIACQLKEVLEDIISQNQSAFLVMSCITSVTYRVKVNKNLTDVIIPQRGLCQGYPLSPYLFIMCVEGLSTLFKQTEEDGSLHGVHVCPAAPRINHLFFMDDSLIFLKVNESSAKKLRDILALYEDASGHMWALLASLTLGTVY
ncbi:uncharacterized protein [Lolium perenne]|uniref:uncharacterized protein n=1 Tax=Lolium perenne TaxID=4522 RepID=UPI0021F601BC|nr:uncharacterized protein LOC127337675 [Lolium perenne]